MKKTITYLATLIVLLVNTSCSDNEVLEANLTSLQTRSIPYRNFEKVTPEEAKQRLLEIYNHKQDDSQDERAPKRQMRVSNNETPQIAEVIPLTVEIDVIDTATNLAVGTQTVNYAYAMNFENEQGFAIMSALQCLPEMFAFIEFGSFPEGKQIATPGASQTEIPCGLETFMSTLDTWVSIKLTYEDDWGSTGDVKYWTDWEYNKRQAGNGIPVCWGQDTPYNKYCPAIGGINCKTGCVATATAQLLAFCKYPEHRLGYDYNWDEMTRFPYITMLSPQGQEQVARLMEQIGSSLGIEYGIEASNGSLKNIPGTLSSFDFYKCGYCSEYNYDRVKKDIDDDMPVLMRGNAKGKKSGHAWIVDKYWERTRQYIKNGKVEKEESDEYLYCNWGGGDPIRIMDMC